MELIYIGNRFYNESKSVMSCVYDINGNRSDWGFVEIALRRGESVHIRPATELECGLYEKRLAKIEESVHTRPTKELEHELYEKQLARKLEK